MSGWLTIRFKGPEWFRGISGVVRELFNVSAGFRLRNSWVIGVLVAVVFWLLMILRLLAARGNVGRM